MRNCKHLSNIVFVVSAIANAALMHHMGVTYAPDDMVQKLHLLLDITLMCGINYIGWLAFRRLMPSRMTRQLIEEAAKRAYEAHRSHMLVYGHMTKSWEELWGSYDTYDMTELSGWMLAAAAALDIKDDSWRFVSRAQHFTSNARKT